MKKIILPLALFFIFSATTYVIKENGVEVGRMEENDGSSEVKTVESASAVPANSREWFEGQSGYNKALQIQKETGEPVMLYFYVTWCPYCKQFEKDILGSPFVENGLKPALKVRINAEKETGLASKYDVRAYPRLFILKNSGEKTRITTSADPQNFMSLCRNLGLKTARS